MYNIQVKFTLIAGDELGHTELLFRYMEKHRLNMNTAREKTLIHHS